MGWMAPERGPGESAGGGGASKAGAGGAGAGGDLLEEAAFGEEARGLLEELLGLMGLTVSVTLQPAEGRVLLEVRGAEAGLVIGRKGATLEALQLVVNKMLARRAGGALRQRVIIDTEGYRARRAEALQAMGRELAAELRSQGRSLAIYGMRAADRRALHVGLAHLEGIRTQSEGEGNGRRLRILTVAPVAGGAGGGPGRSEPDEAEALGPGPGPEGR